MYCGRQQRLYGTIGEKKEIRKAEEVSLIRWRKKERKKSNNSEISSITDRQIALYCNCAMGECTVGGSKNCMILLGRKKILER